MTKIILSLILIFSLPLPRWASHESLSNENLLYLTHHLFKGIGGIKTLKLILSLDENAQTDKDLDLIFKAAGINKEKAMTAFKRFTIATNLINAGIRPTSALAMIGRQETNLNSTISFLIQAIEAKGQTADSTQVAEALRQAEMLFHMQLNTKIAFKENGIDIDLIDPIEQEIQRQKNLTNR